MKTTYMIQYFNYDGGRVTLVKLMVILTSWSLKKSTDIYQNILESILLQEKLYFDSNLFLTVQFDGLVQERHNSGALAMELHLSCTNPLNWQWVIIDSGDANQASHYLTRCWPSLLTSLALTELMFTQMEKF